MPVTNDRHWNQTAPLGLEMAHKSEQTRWTQNSEISDFIWLLLVKRRSRFS
jgi:hypothetical protein